MIQETVLSGTQIIDAFRKEFTNLKTLCLHCHVTDLDGLEKIEKLTTRNLEALDYGQLVRVAVSVGVIAFKK